MKSAFDGFNSRLESIYELQDISIKFLNTTKQREKNDWKQTTKTISKDCGTMVWHSVMYV